MLTPQEVAEHAFAKASFGGYNMAMVDEFLDLLTADYTALYKENAALKTKMKVLADKVEEYRSTDDAMRKALLSAQKYADQVMAEADEKKTALMADAEREAIQRKGELRAELENEELRLSAARDATAAYVSKLKELYQHELEYLSGLSKLTAQPKQADPVAQAAFSTAQAVEKAMEDEISPAEPETPKEPEEPKTESLYEALKKDPASAQEETPPAEEEEEDEPTRRIDFSDLKFGKDYRID